MDTVENITDRYSERVRSLINNQPLTFTPGNSFTPTDTENPPVCHDCGGMGFFRADVPVNHPQFGKLILCDNPVHTSERLDRLAHASNLHAGDLARRLGDIILKPGNAKMLEAARMMIANPHGWLWIHGGPGNAKSEVLISIVNEVNEAGKGLAMYCTFTNLVNWIREAFTDEANESYNQRFQRLLGIKLLAVDEMDKAKDTEWLNEFRFNFLDERYRQAILGESAMVFASNTPPNLLPMALYDRVRDGRFAIVENTTPSARPNMR